jgi:hypothetical protein
MNLINSKVSLSEFQPLSRDMPDSCSGRYGIVKVPSLTVINMSNTDQEVISPAQEPRPRRSGSSPHSSGYPSISFNIAMSLFQATVDESHFNTYRSSNTV